jgi:SagB-type dehydrogenase family enzyme
MNKIDLASPSLREAEIFYTEFSYQIAEKAHLPLPEALPNIPFADILASRRSRRTFRAVSLQQLNSLLWHSARVINVNSPKAIRWQHRPSPSGGGRHPIDLLIFTEERNSENVFLYDPVPHALARLKNVEDSLLDQFLYSINRIITLEQATVVWFAAQFERTLSRYQDGESIVWRDAGALLATISLTAECLGLPCCAIGITGEPLLSGLLNSNGKVVGVGGLLLGERED